MTFWPVIVYNSMMRSWTEDLQYISGFLWQNYLACVSVCEVPDQGWKGVMGSVLLLNSTLPFASTFPFTHLLSITQKTGGEGMPFKYCSIHAAGGSETESVSSSVCTAASPFLSTLTVAPYKHCYYYQLEPPSKGEYKKINSNFLNMLIYVHTCH